MQVLEIILQVAKKSYFLLCHVSIHLKFPQTWTLLPKMPTKGATNKKMLKLVTWSLLFTSLKIIFETTETQGGCHTERGNIPRFLTAMSSSRGDDVSQFVRLSVCLFVCHAFLTLKPLKQTSVSQVFHQCFTSVSPVLHLSRGQLPQETRQLHISAISSQKSMG